MAAWTDSQRSWLRELVRQHQVRYHVGPEAWPTKGGEPLQVGYVIELAGRAPRDHASPGCRRCGEVYLALRAIAAAVVPEAGRPSWYDIRPFDAAWHGHVRPEVILHVAVLHRHDGGAGVDDCQRRCVREMRERLRELGVTERATRETTPFR